MNCDGRVFTLWPYHKSVYYNYDSSGGNKASPVLEVPSLVESAVCLWSQLPVSLNTSEHLYLFFML